MKTKKKNTELHHPARKATFPVRDAELSEFKKNPGKALFAPVDIASVVFLRILFGAIMVWETTRYFSNDWISRYWIEPDFHFTYWPFDFLRPLPGDGMYILFGILGVLAFFIMVGFLYRLTTILFFVGFTYTYLLEQTRYLNHFYLVILISFLLIFIPANKAFSVDAGIKKSIHSDTIPAWCLWVLRFTIGLPYFFGGIAKINADWLMGEPMRSWLASETDFPVIGTFFTEEWMVYLISYGGLLIDLLMIPLLLFPRTRKWAFIAALLFHLMNAELFQIGIFPWFMLVATTLYFHPSWPRKLLYSFYPDRKRREITAGFSWMQQPVTRKQKFIIAGLMLWGMIHILLPFRHVMYPGNVHWTEEGHKYAWHMKLRSKKGVAVFKVIDKNTGAEEIIDNSAYLSGWQERKMAGWPNLVWQFCQIIKKDFKQKGRNVAVYADVVASLNGRTYQQLIDPSIDLASAPRPSLKAAPWIMPLVTPLNLLSKQKAGEDE